MALTEKDHKFIISGGFMVIVGGTMTYLFREPYLTLLGVSLVGVGLACLKRGVTGEKG